MLQLKHSQSQNLPHSLITRFAAIAATLTLTVTACGTHHGSGAARATSTVSISSSSTIPAAPASTQSAGGIFPVSYFALTDTQIDLIEHARFVGAAYCVSQIGVARPKVVTQANALIARELEQRRYGVSDVRAAEKYGFGTPPSNVARQPFGSLTPLQSAVLFGASDDDNSIKIPKGGCIAQADAAITHGQQLETSPIITSLDLHSFSISQRSAEVRRVIRAWSTCMKSHGYSYSSPLESVADQRWRTKTVEPAELRAALADISCKAKSRLIATWTAVETQYQESFIAKHYAAFLAARRTLLAELARAKGVLATESA